MADIAPGSRRFSSGNEAFLKPEVTMQAVRIPRCPVCFERDGIITPNPQGLPECPRCGSAAPAQTDTRLVDSVLTGMPWRAKFLFWVADKLRDLSRWLQEG